MKSYLFDVSPIAENEFAAVGSDNNMTFFVTCSDVFTLRSFGKTILDFNKNDEYNEIKNLKYDVIIYLKDYNGELSDVDNPEVFKFVNRFTIKEFEPVYENQHRDIIIKTDTDRSKEFIISME